MNSGFSFQQAMEILETDENAEIFKRIRHRLNEGQSVSDFITCCTDRTTGAYLHGFLSYMTLRDALSAAVLIVKEEKREQAVLIKGCLYPCLLLGAMCAGIFLFASFVLPTMLSLMNSLNVDSSFDYELLSRLIRVCSIVLLFLLCAFASLCMYALSRKNITSTYLIMAKRFPQSLLVKSATRDFTRFFLECSRRNVSTYESLHMLAQIEEKPLVALIARMLDESLMKGESLEEAMKQTPLESALIRFIHIAAKTSGCTEMLEGYLAMCAKRTEAGIARFSRIVQLTSYALIGLVLIFVYSILMMPMTMLSQI